jgi:hypothetical protein
MLMDMQGPDATTRHGIECPPQFEQGQFTLDGSRLSARALSFSLLFFFRCPFANPICQAQSPSLLAAFACTVCHT